MKRILIALLLAVASFAYGQNWLTDYTAALAQAKAKNKPVLIDFTGSDWCGWCIKLDKEVFNTDEFKTYAAKNLVLLKVDFPKRTPLPPEQSARNTELAKRYGVQGFPTIILLHPDGTKAGEMGYQPGGPKAFISTMEKLSKNRN